MSASCEPPARSLVRVTATVEEVGLDIDFDRDELLSDIEAEEVDRPLTGDEVDFVANIVAKIMLFADQLAGEPLFPYQAGFGSRIAESIVLNDGEQLTALFSRQCIDGDSVVFRRDGTAVRMREHEDAFSTGVHRTKRYRFRGGAELVMTDNHPVWTEEGWTAAGLLRVGSKVSVATYVPEWRGETLIDREVTVDRGMGRQWRYRVTETVDQPLTRWLGYFTTDGSHRPDQSAKFTNINPLYLDEMQSLTEKRFDLVPRRYVKGKGADLLFTARGQRPGANRVRDLLRALSWDHGFPTDVFAWDAETVADFVNRAWSGDGCISMKSSGPDVFLACGKDETYARYWQALLLKYGVMSTVKREQMAKGTGMFHRLVVGSGARNVRRFFAAFGLVYGKEEQSVRALAYFDAKVGRGGKGNAEREMFPHSGIGDDGEECGWSRVVSIEDAGERETFDMEVRGKGWFVAQGLQVSNSGKTQVVAYVIAACMILMPALAKMWPEWFGQYKNGFWVGMFAPVESQAETLFQRVQMVLSSENATALLADPEIDDKLEGGGKLLRLRVSGSICRMQTANPKAQIESKSYHLIVIDEAQRADDKVVNKSIMPMGAFYNATSVMTGTPDTVKGTFYNSIQMNKRKGTKRGARQNHFEHDWRSCARYNKRYQNFVRKEMQRLGEDSDEFALSYALKWLLERGMFTTSERLEELGDSSMQQTVERWFNSPVILGVDPARRQDSTVVTALWVDWANPNEFGFYDHRVLNWLELHGDRWEEQYGRIVDFASHYDVLAVAVDGQGVGDVVADRLARLMPRTQVEMLGSSPVEQSARWKHLMEIMNLGLIGWPAGARVKRKKTYQRFIQQMTDLEKEYRGRYLLAAAPNQAEAHDDYPDSLALACMMTKAVSMPEAETGSNPFYARSR